MEEYPFDTTGLTEEATERYYTAYKALKDEFKIQHTGHIDFNLQQFEVFKKCLSVKLRDSFVIKQDCGDSYLLFVEVHYKIGETKEVSNHQEYQVWGLTYLKNNFGRAIIRRETLTDKLLELLHPLELDFKEDKAFSNTFYVVVNDHAKATAGMTRDFRNAVMDIRDNDFMTEIVDHTIIIGNYDPIIAEKSLHIGEFVARIAGSC